MRPVCQEIVCSEKGDCERAAIASLLGVPLQEIPYWPNDNSYHANQSAWMDSRGLGFVECYNDPANGFPFRLTAVDGVECIASVPSQLFKGKSHAIIAKFEMQDSGVVLLRPMHDPNPKNEPYPDSLMDVATWVTFVVPRVQNLLPANMPSTGVEVID